MIVRSISSVVCFPDVTLFVAEQTDEIINTYYSNYDNKAVSTVALQLISSSKNERVQEAFKDVQFVQALKQPPNLLRTLANSALIRNDNTVQPGVYKCNDKRCKICRSYLQDDVSFKMANGFL